jgi:LysM repeat protein
MLLARLLLVAVLSLTGVACTTNPFAPKPVVADPYASNYGAAPVQGGYAQPSGAPVYPQYQTPTPAPATSYVPPVPAPSFNAGGRGSTHTVAPGDTLYGLSRRYGSSVSALKSANGLSSDTIVIGQQLRIP